MRLRTVDHGVDVGCEGPNGEELCSGVMGILVNGHGRLLRAWRLLELWPAVNGR